MKVEVVMPQMGESIAEGTIVKWHKQQGERVEKDEILLEISTDKVDSEIPATHEGILDKIVVEEGETVEVGTTIAYLETESDGEVRQTSEPEEETAVADSAEEESPEVAREQETAESPRMSREWGDEPTGKHFYSPLVLSIADKEGITREELASIEGTGINGRVRKQDLLEYLEQREARPARKHPEPIKYTGPMEGVDVLELDHMRQSIARHMRTSLDTSAHVYSVSEVDMSAISKFRDREKQHFRQQEGFKLTYTPFIIDAVIKALKEYPRVNASVDMEDGKIYQKNFINVGVAVAIESGLIVPVIKNADERSFLGIARETHSLADKARKGNLSPEDVQNGTFTVTNPGIFGNLYGLPIIHQPQVAILGVGAIKKRPVVINDAIGIRPMMYLTLSYDHRILDGAIGGQFLQSVVEFLEEFNGEGVI